MSDQSTREALEEISTMATRLQGCLNAMTSEHKEMIWETFKALNQIEDEIFS